MTEDEYEQANNLVMEKKQAEERINVLKSLKNLHHEAIKLTATYQSDYYYLTLTEEDIEVLIDHEEMKVGEYNRKFQNI